MKLKAFFLPALLIAVVKMPITAQQLELNGTTSFSTAAMGPLPISANANSTDPLGRAATLYLNTGTSNLFTSNDPATTITISFANQQYTSFAYPGLTIGSYPGWANNDTLDANNIFQPINSVGSPLNNMFTSAPNISTAGSNFDVDNNYGFFMGTDANYQTGPLTDRNYYGDIVINFSNPVINPIIHISGVGGHANFQGFYTEFELGAADVSAGHTFTRLSGSNCFQLDATNTKILDTNTVKYTDTASYIISPYSSSQLWAGSGSVMFNTNNIPITTITLRVYLRGDGGVDLSSSWEGGLDIWLLSVSLGTYNVSGTVFNDTNRLMDSTVNGTGTNAGGLYANLVDANGEVYVSTAVAADGSYSFNNVITSSYTIILSAAQPAIGSALSSASLPTGYFSTGENIGSGVGNDGVVNSKLPIVVASNSINNANLGLTKGTLLPVILTNFTAVLQNAIPVLQWSTQVAESIRSFDVQRSEDGNSWSTVGNIKATGNDASNYSFSDKNMAAGKHYYRLAIIENDGTIKYSMIRLLSLQTPTIISVFPNPVQNTLHIKTNNFKNIQQVRLTDSKGELVWTATDVQKAIPVSKLSAGVYILYIYEMDGHIQIEKIIKK